MKLARRGVSNEAREHFLPRAHRVHGQLIRNDDGRFWAGNARITSPISPSIRFRANRPASTASADISAHARAHTHAGYELTSTSSAAATHEQRNCRSSGKVLNLKIVLDWFSGAISPMAKCWTTKAGHTSRGRRRAKVSGVSEGVAPEGTPQRLCPHSPVLSKNGGWPTTTSNAMLARTMQRDGP